MRRLVSGVGLVAWVLLSLPAVAAAQDDMARRASLFDIGIYAGGAYTTDWFEIGGEGDEEGWGPGLAPVFGVQAHYWMSPTFGIRLNGFYMPTDFAPEGFGEDRVDILIIDLDAAIRSDTGFIPLPRGVRAFAGLSYISATPDGGDRSDGFGFNLGAGSTFLPLGPTLSPFVDVVLRGYPSPFDNVDDNFVFGGELVVGVNITVQ